LDEVADVELAAVDEALGDSWHRAGDYPKASEAFMTARRLAARDPLRMAGLLLKTSKMEEKLGKYPQALRWAARARKAIEGLTGPEVARQSAHLSGWYATVLQAQGRGDEAIRWAERAIREAEAVDDPEAIGAAYFVMGWAYGDLGRDGVELLFRRALEGLPPLGECSPASRPPCEPGVACGWEGRWDEAIVVFEQAREESLKIGNTVDAELARINIAEILTDRGELGEAQRLLDESLPMWRALNYRYFLGACLALLGRVGLRAGRTDVALDGSKKPRRTSSMSDRSRIFSTSTLASPSAACSWPNRMPRWRSRRRRWPA
jgi:tetratricopeptide (TPR) repeat protein